MTKKEKRWIKFRHSAIRKFFYFPVKLFCKIRYGVKIEKFRGKGNYLILANHQTDGDQLFTGLAFTKPLYSLATEDIFSNGFKSRLLEYAFAPLPFDKTQADFNSIRRLVKVAKEGGSICIFPEGNRTYSGKTEYIKPAIIKLIKLIKLPIAIFKIDGGYGVQPRWGRGNRKGELIARVVEVIPPEKYLEMDSSNLYDEIKQKLFQNEAEDNRIYKGSHRAEYMERIIYTCPKCGFTTWVSKGNKAKCVKCGLVIDYGENKKIKSTNGKLPFSNMAEWIDCQNNFVSSMDMEKFSKESAFIDTVKLFKVKPYKNKKKIDKRATISLYSDKLIVKAKRRTEQYNFCDLVGVSVLGRNKLNFNTGSELFQLKGNKRFNAAKYINFYYNYKNKNGGGIDGFFGL